MARIERYSLTLSADPAGTADQVIELHDLCPVHAIRLTYSGLPNTTDVTITDGYSGGSTVLAVADSNTSKLYYPVVAVSESADGSVSTLTETIPIAERLRIQVAQGDPNGTLTVDAYVAH